MTDARAEFPNSWFAGAKPATAGRDSSLNYFGVHASQPLSTWRKNGWIHSRRLTRLVSSGTAATTWAAASRKKTTDRSAVGKQCDGTSGKLSVTANQAIRCAVSGNARRFYTGRTTAEHRALRYRDSGCVQNRFSRVTGWVANWLNVTAAGGGVDWVVFGRATPEGFGR